MFEYLEAYKKRWNENLIEASENPKIEIPPFIKEGNRIIYKIPDLDVAGFEL